LEKAAGGVRGRPVSGGGGWAHPGQKRRVDPGRAGIFVPRGRKDGLTSSRDNSKIKTRNVKPNK